MAGSTYASLDDPLERHLRSALEAEGPTEKNYHVREALQALLVDRADLDPER